MTLPGGDMHSARLAALLAGQLLLLTDSRDEGRMSECAYQLNREAICGLAYQLGLTGFLARLLEPRGPKGYDA